MTCLPDELLLYIKEKLMDDRLLKLMNGNPRSMKRICNIITIALSCYPGSRVTQEQAFILLLIVIMVEQWPFRYMYLYMYTYM